MTVKEVLEAMPRGQEVVIVMGEFMGVYDGSCANALIALSDIVLIGNVDEISYLDYKKAMRLHFTYTDENLDKILRA